MISVTFKIAQGETMCSHELEDGAYKHHKRTQCSENYFKIENP